MSLIWIEPYKIDDETLEKNILEMEEIHGVKFPKLYKEMIRKKSIGFLGQEVMKKGYKYEDDIYRIHFESFDFDAECNIKLFNIWHEDVRPKGIIFWSQDGGGDAIAFDFKDNLDNPKIVYYSHEMVSPVSDYEGEGLSDEEIEEDQRSCYEVIYDSIEEMYSFFEIAQEYWIKRKFGSKDTAEYKDYVKLMCGLENL